MNLRILWTLIAVGWHAVACAQAQKPEDKSPSGQMNDLTKKADLVVSIAEKLKLVSSKVAGTTRDAGFYASALTTIQEEVMPLFQDGVSPSDFAWATIHASNVVNAGLYGIVTSSIAGAKTAAAVTGLTGSPIAGEIAGVVAGSKVGGDAAGQYNAELRDAVSQLQTLLGQRPGIYQNQSGASQGIVDMTGKGDLVNGADVAEKPKEKLDGLDLTMLKVARRNLDAKLAQMPAEAKSMPGFPAAVATMRGIAEKKAPEMAQGLANRLANGDAAAIEFFQACEAYAAERINYTSWVKAHDKYKASKPTPAPKNR